MTYWNIGRQIVEEEQHGENRAEYGIRLIEAIAHQLTQEFGASYSKRNLQYYRKFYLCFSDPEIVNTRVHNLSWSHFRSLLRVADDDARLWYLREAADENWGVRTLDRNRTQADKQTMTAMSLNKGRAGASDELLPVLFGSCLIQCPGER